MVRQVLAFGTMSFTLNSGHWQYCQSIAKSFDAETLARIIGCAIALTCSCPCRQHSQ